MTPERDAEDIWGNASQQGIAKYLKGQAEHKTAFWSAGAEWYADQLEDEILDLVSYFHHLRKRIKAIRSVAELMATDEVGLHEAAAMLKDLTDAHPPRTRRKQSHD
jgi:CHAD domain-containing protein